MFESENLVPVIVAAINMINEWGRGRLMSEGVAESIQKVKYKHIP